MKKVILSLALLSSFSIFAEEKLCGKIESLYVVSYGFSVRLIGIEQTLLSSSTSGDELYLSVLAAAKANDLTVCFGNLGKVKPTMRQTFGSVEI